MHVFLIKSIHRKPSITFLAIPHTKFHLQCKIWDKFFFWCSYPLEKSWNTLEINWQHGALWCQLSVKKICDNLFKRDFWMMNSLYFFDGMYTCFALDFYCMYISATFALKKGFFILTLFCISYIFVKKCKFWISIVFLEIETKNIHFIKNYVKKTFVGHIEAKNFAFSRFFHISYNLTGKSNFKIDFFQVLTYCNFPNFCLVEKKLWR